MSIEEIIQEISNLPFDEKEKIMERIIGIAMYEKTPDIHNIRQ